MQPYASDIRLTGTDQAQEPDGLHAMSSYLVRYPVRGLADGGGVAITVRDGIVDSLFVGTDSTSYGLTLSEVLSVYGIPSEVLIHTVSDHGAFGFPFFVVLFYGDQHFMLVYEMEASREGHYVKACPKSTLPQVTAWTRHDDWSDEKIQTYILGPGY
jgi:hypothetical protein